MAKQPIKRGRDPRFTCKACGLRFIKDVKWRRHMTEVHNFQEITPGVWVIK